MRSDSPAARSSATTFIQIRPSGKGAGRAANPRRATAGTVYLAGAGAASGSSFGAGLTSISGLYAVTVTSGATSQASSKLYIVIASQGQTSAHSAQPMHLSHSMMARLFGESG